MRIKVKFMNSSCTKYYEDVNTFYIKKEQDKRITTKLDLEEVKYYEIF